MAVRDGTSRRRRVLLQVPRQAPGQRQPKLEYYDKVEPDDKRDMDPNHESIFEHERDAAWLKAT